ncbi:MAG: flap endonuclease [SAR202 cluster bacterium]|nr:flap endonuclease [Chloroflexota bacterium]MQG49970.1 flap endonuclease [SAR202 cluster bacterium]PKB73837.1 MAG: flap endonuclease [SAR202 cluster bacterium Io17-Chloro-G8]MAN95281.1 flap endonuclease [Chloroflexota bacterium]MAQ53324.1 flap endonuclease [Chloroflexota bacterium]|tara:strand:- start:3277 stop:4158 length:882 start_codon:yes stop_codon:yes gene_type:complete
MKVHLVDGTYELFRSYFALPPIQAPDGRPVGAVRGIVQSLLYLLREDQVTHVGCAFDHVVKSFRNDMFDGYKTGNGTPEDLLAQFELAERAVESLGILAWPMVEYEADDAIATATAYCTGLSEVEQVVICSPDKDLAQMVQGDSVVCYDRRRETVMGETGVIEKFGVSPGSIPDLLALTGDAADGIPGIPKWGAKTSAQLLAQYGHIEDIPHDAADWEVKVRGAAAAAESLNANASEARLYKDLTTLRTDVPIAASLAALEWKGVDREKYQALCDDLGFGRLASLPHKWSDGS